MVNMCNTLDAVSEDGKRSAVREWNNSERTKTRLNGQNPPRVPRHALCNVIRRA